MSFPWLILLSTSTFLGLSFPTDLTRFVAVIHKIPHTSCHSSSSLARFHPHIHSITAPSYNTDVFSSTIAPPYKTEPTYTRIGHHPTTLTKLSSGFHNARLDTQTSRFGLYPCFLDLGTTSAEVSESEAVLPFDALYLYAWGSQHLGCGG